MAIRFAFSVSLDLQDVYQAYAKTYIQVLVTPGKTENTVQGRVTFLTPALGPAFPLLSLTFSF